MKCIVCESPMESYFSKSFDVYDLGTVEYVKCPRCGFCASKTHFDMTDDEWTRLNAAFHSDNHFRSDNPYSRNQRYFNQAFMLFLMTKHGLLAEGSWLDWGCGLGSLAVLMDRYFEIALMTHDKYFEPKINRVTEAELVPHGFDLVVNTAVIEHFRSRSTLDEVESYTNGTGRFAVHTLVVEEVPRDPDWMYLLPVHCAFYTNRSMQLLMDDWGYRSSVYNENAKMWVMFRDEPEHTRRLVDELNDSLGWEYLHFKNGFMDYWK